MVPVHARPPTPTAHPGLEAEERLGGLHIAGLGAFWLEEWNRACRNFQELVDQRPDGKDAAARLQEAERKWYQNEPYSQVREARRAGNWAAVLARLEELGVASEDIGYSASTEWFFEALGDVMQVARGDCDGPSLDIRELSGVQAYDTDPQRQVVIAHLTDWYSVVLEGDVTTSIAALLAIMLGLFLLVAIAQKQKEAI